MSAKHEALRVGVVGLGRRWRRHYRPAVLGLGHRFDVLAVCDPVPAHAQREAQQLDCAAAAGPVELLGRSDLDALLLLDPGWWRLWPLQLACKRGLPVFCAASLADDDRHADSLRYLVRDSRLPVQMALPARLAPVAARLDELLAGELGAVRSVVCDVATSKEKEPLPGLSLGLLDWIARLVGRPPTQVTTRALPSAGLASVLCECAGGTAVQILCRRVAAGGGVRLQVEAERGGAVVVPPRWLRWTVARGKHAQSLPRPRPAARVLLEQFHEAIMTGGALAPDLEETYGPWQWLRAARYSLETGRAWPGVNGAPAEAAVSTP